MKDRHINILSLMNTDIIYYQIVTFANVFYNKFFMLFIKNMQTATVKTLFVLWYSTSWRSNMHSSMLCIAADALKIFSSISLKNLILFWSVCAVSSHLDSASHRRMYVSFSLEVRIVPKLLPQHILYEYSERELTA